jgi:hypothetical protein|tara:strand:- start:304 stop:1125 length:822 start_codon:yes stop_codon:yes gene_type:complete
MSIDRFRNLAYNPLVQLGLGGLLGGLSGQAPGQAFGQTGNQFMQLGRQLEQQEALKVLSQMPELNTMQRQLIKVAPGEVVKSLLEDKTTVGTRLLTDPEKKQEGFDLTDVVQIDAQGNRKVLKSIPAGEKSKAATRKTVLSSIDKIVTDVDKLGTGFFEGRLKGLTTPFSPKQAKFRADTKQLELNVIKALRGAQVSAAEEDNVRKILPQVTDSETMYKAKAESLREYLQELDTRIEGGVITKESQVLKKDIEEKNNFEFKIGDDGIYDVTGG